MKILITAELRATYQKEVTVSKETYKRLKKAIKNCDYDYPCEFIDPDFKSSDNNDVYWGEASIDKLGS